MKLNINHPEICPGVFGTAPAWTTENPKPQVFTVVYNDDETCEVTVVEE